MTRVKTRDPGRHLADIAREVELHPNMIRFLRVEHRIPGRKIGTRIYVSRRDAARLVRLGESYKQKAAVYGASDDAVQAG